MAIAPSPKSMSEFGALSQGGGSSKAYNPAELARSRSSGADGIEETGYI
jgi:hypothetical protein